MTLWNIIRDWFVQYVWGGVSSQGDYFSTNIIGTVFNFENQSAESVNTYDYFIKLNGFNHVSDSTIDYISFGDWLSTTSTIIVLVLMCVFLFLVVRYLFRLTSGLIRGH